MTALTPVAGYPLHRVTRFSRWTNPHGARFTDWQAACGAVGCDSGHNAFSQAGSSRRLERCTSCFPGRDAKGYFPDPVQVGDGRQRLSEVSG